MKTKTTQSEPPAIAGGLTQGSTTASESTSSDSELNTSQVQPPATAGGSDSIDTLAQLQTENARLKAAIRLSDARNSVTAELAKAGARSPELLFETLTGELQFDGEGKVQNLAATVERLKAKFPEQFGTQIQQSIDGGAGQTVTPRLTRDALRRMKPSEIAELDWADVRRVLSS